MAFKINYGMQRADRNRAAQARSEQKQRKRKKEREERSAQRKAECIVEIKSSPNEFEGISGEVNDARRI
ncbi:MAG: hypothetical protein ABSF41_04560 [Pseudolabrys sp.]|jgi:hypothetical protein